MKVSMKGDYGVRALVELAHHFGEGPVQSAVIANRQSIPEPYLDQLLTSLRRAGFTVKEVPTEWTDKIGSKVTSSLFRTSLVMFLSTFRVRLIYSPFYKWLSPLRPLETRLYRKLRAPLPRRNPKDDNQG